MTSPNICLNRNLELFSPNKFAKYFKTHLRALKVINNIIQFEKGLYSGGIPLNVYIPDCQSESIGAYLHFPGVLRLSRADDGVLECEVLNGQKLFVLSFSYEEIILLGTGIGNEIGTLRVVESTCLYLNVRKPKPQLTMNFATEDLRYSVFLSVLILTSNRVGKPIKGLVAPHVHVDLDVGYGSVAHQGIIGDNIEYLVYLDVPITGNLGTKWLPRLVVATRETLRLYTLPPASNGSKSMQDEVHFSESLKKYFVNGGFNDEIMADMDFELDLCLDFSTIYHITHSQIGPNSVIEVTHEGSGEEEDGEKLILRSSSMLGRDKALEGLFTAFKKRRRGKKQVGESEDKKFR